MPTNSYTASLNYYDSSYGWANEGTCSQGNCTPWGGGSARTGVMYFSGLSSLKGKIINSVTFTVTNGESGYGYDAYKTAHFYRSAHQGGISTSLGANHRTGGQIGTWRNMFHALNGTTMSFNPTFFSSHIRNGDDTFCIYSNDSSDYFKWKKVTISVNWSEPYTTTTGWSVTSSIALGGSGTVSIPSLSGSNASNYHTVTYQTSAGGYSGTISSRLTSGQSATFYPSLSWASAIPSNTAMTCTITTTTYTSGGSWVGANSKTITLTVPNNSSTKPSCSVSVTAVDPTGNGAYVSGFSQVRANMSNMVGKYGASVRTYSISMSGWSTSGNVSGSSMSATSPTLSGSGSRTITLTVTDSRGYSNSTSTSFTVLGYTRPLITSFQAFRTSSATSTTQDLTGSYLRVVIQLSPSSPSISGNSHTGTLSCSPTVSGMPSSVTSNYSHNFSISNGSSYSLTFTYGDEYSRSTVTASVSSVAVPLDIRYNGTAIGIGKYAETNNLVDIGLNTRIREDLQVDGSIEEKRRRTAYDLNTPGWYKICEFPSNTVALGREYLLALGRWYNYTDSEVYLINVACAYQTGTIHLVGKQVNATGFSQAALYLDSSNTISLYVYYTQSVTNGCQVDMLANSADFTLSLEPMSPAGTLLSELNLSAPAVSSRNTICQWRRRYHPDDGISEDDAITEYSFVYGGNTALGLSGPMLSIGTLGSYDTDGRGKYRMQLAGDYSSGTVFRIRTYDGDSNEWNPWRSIYTNANTIPVSNGGTGATSVASARTNLGFGKVIWAGTWSSGSISVSELTSYRLLGFDISGSSLLILGARDRDTSSSDIRAFGVVHSGGNAQADAFMLAASYSGGTLTMSDCYSVNVITGAKTTRSIYAIIGIS